MKSKLAKMDSGVSFEHIDFSKYTSQKIFTQFLLLPVVKDPSFD